MKAALIPPYGFERTALNSNIHLVLPLIETMSNDLYIGTYIAAKVNGHYIILDNGAAEGKLRPAGVIMNSAELFSADEVVAPDVLGDFHQTHALVADFMNNFDDYCKYYSIRPKVQAVLQGQTFGERAELLKYYSTHPDIKVIGIPKVTIREKGDPIRAEIARYIQQRYPGRFEIHLLGASPYFPTELLDVDFPKGIRSTDSTLPYKLAALGLGLNENTVHVKRWSGYFDTVYQGLTNMGPLIEQNILTYMTWAARHEG